MDSPDFLSWFIPLVLVVAIWDAVWKLLAMWRAARNQHKVWFICIAIINTVGILPIIYLLNHKEEENR